ncbi:MAG: hypothetical protein IKR77_01180 [Bacteroidales bacterium]|nr:hypothetical protein [Bacteroidales bacterium]
MELFSRAEVEVAEGVPVVVLLVAAEEDVTGLVVAEVAGLVAVLEVAGLVVTGLVVVAEEAGLVVAEDVAGLAVALEEDGLAVEVEVLEELLAGTVAGLVLLMV